MLNVHACCNKVLTVLWVVHSKHRYVLLYLLQNFREKNRASKLFNNLSSVSEAIPALGWVSVVSSLPFFLLKLILIYQVKTKKITTVKEVWIPGLNKNRF